MLLFNFHTECKNVTFVDTNRRTDILTRKVMHMKNSYNKIIFYLNEKIYVMEIILFEYKIILIE